MMRKRDTVGVQEGFTSSCFCHLLCPFPVVQGSIKQSRQKRILMKIKMLAATTLLSLMHAGASDLPLTIDQNCLKLYGQEGNAYQFESSTNLEDWIESGDFFILSTVPHTQAVSVAESLRFFRAKALVMATNDSYAD